MKEREVLWCRERGINPWGWWLYTRRILLAADREDRRYHRLHGRRGSLLLVQ